MGLFALGFWHKALLKVIYTILLCLAIYLIYIGDIVQKFQRRRTNFAEYGEEISELPTINLFLEYNTDDILDYEKDFWVIYQPDEGQSKSLTLGENYIEGVTFHLEVTVDKPGNTSIYFSYQTLVLKPLGFTSKMLVSHNLMLEFEESSDYKKSVSKVGFSLSAANNSYCGLATFPDGDVEDTFVELGELSHARVIPEKYIFIQEVQECRTQPYQQILSTKISEQIFDECDRPCKPSGWTCKFGVALDQIEICKSATGLKCFHEVESTVMSGIVAKPCTILQYKISATPYPIKLHNNVGIRLIYSTPMQVSVKEEYLIYDMLAMISAIGGTMGLCIGFSFFAFISSLWTLGSKAQESRTNNNRAYEETQNQ